MEDEVVCNMYVCVCLSVASGLLTVVAKGTYISATSQFCIFIVIIMSVIISAVYVVVILPNAKSAFLALCVILGSACLGDWCRIFMWLNACWPGKSVGLITSSTTDLPVLLREFDLWNFELTADESQLKYRDRFYSGVSGWWMKKCDFHSYHQKAELPPL